MPGAVLIICKAGRSTSPVACGTTCQLTVGIAVLDNQTAQIKRVGYQLTGFFNSHAFFLTQLEQQLCILFLLGIVFRIDNGCLGNVTKSPLRCTSVDFSRIAQKNQVCNTICQNLIWQLAKCVLPYLQEER